MPRLQKLSGIYKIENTVNGKAYVGSAVDLHNRWSTHIWMLRHGKHKNPILQASFLKHGESAFRFVILEECPREATLVREQVWLDALNPYYNINRVATSRLGSKASPESNRKRSETQKGRPGNPLTPEAKRKISEAHKGRKWDPAVVETRRQSMLKVTADPEYLAGMSERSSGESNPFFGKKHSDESRAKIRERRWGAPTPTGIM